MRRHKLKCWPKYFADVRAGVKTFEVRRNDREYVTGDVITLCEFAIHPENDHRSALSDGEYTGETETVIVTYVTALPELDALKPGWVILGIA